LIDVIPTIVASSDRPGVRAKQGGARADTDALDERKQVRAPVLDPVKRRSLARRFGAVELLLVRESSRLTDRWTLPHENVDVHVLDIFS
jgi:hypothetical protein